MQCDQSCNIGQDLDYSDCKCEKKLIDLLIEECTANNDETKLVNITLAKNENSYCNSCKVYIVFMTVVFTVFTGVTIYFVYYKWSLIKNNISCTKFSTHKETLIWWIKNQTYYFCNYIIAIEAFDSSMLKLDKKSYEDLDIYNIGCVTVKKIGYGYGINSENPLYLHINNVNGYIEQINEDKYLVFDVTYENKESLKRYDDVFNGIMGKIRNIDDDWLEYAKDYMKIKFNSDDNLPLNKPWKFYNMTVTIRCVFEEDTKLYLQVFLDEALYSL